VTSSLAIRLDSFRRGLTDLIHREISLVIHRRGFPRDPAFELQERSGGVLFSAQLQIHITQLAREGSPPPGLRLAQAKLSRNSNQIARGRIRRFES
jgi:hypothetical protein